MLAIARTGTPRSWPGTALLWIASASACATVDKPAAAPASSPTVSAVLASPARAFFANSTSVAAVPPAVAAPASNAHDFYSALTGHDLVGDTFDLVTVGDTFVPDLRTLPCAHKGRSDRIIIRDDSSYVVGLVERPACANLIAEYSGSLRYGHFKVAYDTLVFYTGDGDEVFQSGSGIVSRDSMVPIAHYANGARYIRRRAVRAAPPP
jgi:hypothetical protein